MDLYPHHVLEVLSKTYNEYSRKAAYWRQCDHDTWDKHATGASAVLETIDALFSGGKYFFKFETETIGNVTFEWRKMEVL